MLFSRVCLPLIQVFLYRKIRLNVIIKGWSSLRQQKGGQLFYSSMIKKYNDPNIEVPGLSLRSD
ncbi:hypothetical protein PAECIP112173_02433 [Paenibacillus sp. JJ-100]|nr:hypothetical protein PAECIP112173_02433 [Paenibacillus sp. JJ-100]